jgi:hypothetical protein
MSVPCWLQRARPRAALVLVAIASAVLWSMTACGTSTEMAAPSTGAATSAATSPASSAATSSDPSAATTDIANDELTTAARTRVFFGHQSVGMNVLDAVPAVFAAHNMAAPLVEEGSTGPGSGGGFVTHAFIGENEKPLLKIDDFDAKLRSGIGKQVDVAMMKFCWVDVTRGTDENALFARYRETLSALERDFPSVSFVKVTVPLTTRQGGPEADNVVREQLNALIRQEYTGHHLFDLALVESTAPDGRRVSGMYQGKEFFALYAGYAADQGHLNSTGARRAASAWLQAVAEAAQA